MLRNYYGWSLQGANPPEAAMIAESVVLLLRMFNHSTNIIISTVTNTQFRKALTKKLLCRKQDNAGISGVGTGSNM